VVPWFQGGRVREARGVKPALEAIVHLRPYRQEVELQDACRWWPCCQPDAILHVQEAWKGG
jgi:hypothetical protein